MLISTMNHKEVYAEFMQDLNKIESTTLERLFSEYDRERKKRKINPASEYARIHTIKTKAKNNWIIILRKPYSIDKYKNTGDICYCCITYYYDKKGLKVLRKCEDDNSLEVYWGHFFNRYNERMHLNLSTPLEVIKTFFLNSGSIGYHIYLKKENKTVGMCREGFLFGSLDKESKWIINKTFVSKEIAFESQNKAGEKIMQMFGAKLSMQLMKEDGDERDNVHQADLFMSMTGKLTA